ncbi:helix-turn-helix domain-containing protein [Vibrio tapetis]|uniref:Putative AraC family transcriptional regulator n=1 Tax=Vibrio tapetis subsp. tapetis TaxID=1671868 RepID=A0A2N8ZMY3_9VIBR|nr:AraC family transcriptional regulator [Vibrio tapetis]SON53237.1 putative AraC family transcriptional regulator [Vibrio tapetis subsp. tapetis]
MSTTKDGDIGEFADFQIAKELGGLELLDASYNKQNFSRHSHEGFTVGVIEQGAQRFFRTGGNHIAPQDSIILVNAEEVHNGHSATDYGWSYKAMYPLPCHFESLYLEGTQDQHRVPYFPEPVVHDPHLATQLRLLFKTLKEDKNRLLRESLVYATLSMLIQRHGKKKADLSTKNPGEALVIVKEFLDDFPQADVSLDDLAKLANLSPFYFVRCFQKQFGLPPHAYQIQARLRYAKSLLLKGFKISDVALEAGFHDQSHFHRHFKKAMGVTPGDYIKNM